MKRAYHGAIFSKCEEAWFVCVKVAPEADVFDGFVVGPVSTNVDPRLYIFSMLSFEQRSCELSVLSTSSRCSDLPIVEREQGGRRKGGLKVMWAYDGS